MSDWATPLLQLLTRTSTDLPADVEAALRHAHEQETPGSAAAQTLATLLENAALARARNQPLCQDTGTILVWVSAPAGLPQEPFRQGLRAAVVAATQHGLLRPNAVDPISGTNSGDNLGAGAPAVHWEEADVPTVRVTLMLKGGGCENVGRQYALPFRELDASRDLEGVRRCLLHAVHEAQGLGCPPGILGVCVGGDRASGYAESKRQLLRPLGVRSPQPALAALEERVLAGANQLGIGPMGIGGRCTLLGVAVGALHRVPASFFVSVSYMCWACRRHTLEADPAGRFLNWLA